MAEGRNEHDWGIASEMLALIYNANRGTNSPALTADQINPCKRRAKEQIPKVSIEALKVFL